VIKADKCQQEKDRLEKEIPTLERNLQKARQSQVFPGAISLYQQQLDAAKDELAKQTYIMEQNRSVSNKAQEILLSHWSQPKAQPEIKKMSETMEKMESQMQDLKTQATRSTSNSSVPDDKLKAINHNISKLRETDASTTNNLTNIEGRLKAVEAALPTLQRKSEAPTGTMEVRVQKLEKSIHSHSVRLGHVDVSSTKSYKDLEANVSELQGNVSKLQGNVSRLESNNFRLDSDLKMVDKKHQDKISGVNNELKKANNELSGRVFPLERQVTLLQSQPRPASGGAPSGTPEASSSFTNHRLSSLEQEVQAQGTTIQGIIKIHQDVQDEYFAELEKLKTSIDSLKDDHEKAKQDVIRIDQKNEDLVKKVGTSDASIGTLRNFYTKVETDLSNSNQQLRTELDNYRSACAGSIEGLEKNLDNYRSDLMASMDKIRSDLSTYCSTCSMMVNRLRNELNEATKRIETMIPAFQEANKCTELLTSHSVSLRSLEMRWSNITTGDLVKSMSDAMLEMSPLVNLNQKVQTHVTETRNKFATLTADIAQMQQPSQLSPGDKNALAAYPWMLEKVNSLSQRIDPMQTALDHLSTLAKDMDNFQQPSQLSPEDKKTLAQFPKMFDMVTTILQRFGPMRESLDQFSTLANDVANLRQQSQLSPEDRNTLAQLAQYPRMLERVTGLSQRVELMENTFNQHTPSLQKLLQEMSHLSNKVTANEEMIFSVDAKFDDLNPTEPSPELIESMKKIDPLIVKVDGHILQLEQVKKDVAEFNRAEAERCNAGLQDLTEVNARLSELEDKIPQPGEIPHLLAEMEGAKLRDEVLEHRLADLGSKAEEIGHQLADLKATRLLTEELRAELDFLSPKIAELETQYQAIEDDGIKLTDDQFKRLRERLAGEPIHNMLHRLRKAEDDIKQAFSNAGRPLEVRALTGPSTNTSSPAKAFTPSSAVPSVPTLGVHVPVNPASLPKYGPRVSQQPGAPAQLTPPTKPGLSSGASSGSGSTTSSLKKPENQQVQSLKVGKRRHSSGTPSEDERSTPGPSSTASSPAPSIPSSLSKKEKKEMKAKRKAEREAERETRESSVTKPKKQKQKHEA
jgi:DNA repair exonuclease SbcCD ATPase subunit